MSLASSVEKVGRKTVGVIEEWGYYLALFAESFYWLLAGRFKRQPVRLPEVFAQMRTIGVGAIAIVFVLSFSVGAMLAIQGVHNLKRFGAESQVVVGIALMMTRELGPMLTAILVAGRSGSALTARIGTMQVSQEIDALRVMGINPVRYLVSPVLLAMLIALPSLTILSELAGLFGGAVYNAAELDISYRAYADRCFAVLKVTDIAQGLMKSLMFAVIITLVGVSNGFAVTGGAEGVGRATTRAVVLMISFIVLSNMIATYYFSRKWPII